MWASGSDRMVRAVLAGLNPGSYGGGIYTDLSKPFPPAPPNPAEQDLQNKIQALRSKLQEAQRAGKHPDPKDIEELVTLQSEREALGDVERERNDQRYQNDWAARVEHNGKISGVFTDYHYYGTGDIGGAPSEDSVKRLEAIVTQGSTSLPVRNGNFFRGERNDEPPVKVGDGPVHVVSANAEQMFLDITPSEAAGLPRYTGEMELTNHSAGSLTSQAYQKRWIRKEELLADAAEKASIAAEWLGARPYPLQRLNDAWTLAMGGHFHDIAAGTATPRSYEFAWNDDVIALNQFAGVLSNATEAVTAALNTEAKGIPLVVFNPLNIAREDLVEASVNFPGSMPIPKNVRVTGPDGKEVPAQISHGKVIFVAKAPSVGYAVYDVQPTAESADAAASAASVRELTREQVLPREAELRWRRLQHFRQVDWQGIAGFAGTSGHFLRQSRAVAGLEHGLGSGAGCAEGIRQWSGENSRGGKRSGPRGRRSFARDRRLTIRPDR